MLRMTCTTTRSYDVVLTSDVLDPRKPDFSDAVGSQRGLVVLDALIEAEYGPRLKQYLTARMPGFDVLSIELSERSKTVETALAVCAAAQEHGLARRDVLVAVGGGVCCDVVSVAASLVRRGLPYVAVPTTLLAQVDAGIAVKGAVNFGGSKNYLGCFEPPAGVLVDPTFLRTLDRAELTSGLAEMAKMALVRDAALADDLRAHGRSLVESGFTAPAGVGERLIARSVQLMLEELSADPYEEAELRRLVDFGHTFSARFEELAGHALRHGEAVALDMALSSALAFELGILGEADLDAVLSLLHGLGLPVATDLATEEELLAAVRATVAHRAGALNLVVPTRVGEATFVTSPAELGRDDLARAARRVATYAADHAPTVPAGRTSEPGEGG